MARGEPSHGAHQVARKTARGKPLNSSLAAIRTALNESPLPKGGTTNPNIQEDNSPPSETVPRPLETPEHPPSQQNLSSSSHLASVRLSPEPTPSSSVRRGQISDSCYQQIVELFAKRYITTFDRDRLALENAYVSDSTFSCRHIPISSPSPNYLKRCNIGTLQGHSNIIQTISSFSRLIMFVPSTMSVLDVTIDILRLPDMSYFVVMAFDTVVEGLSVSVDMVFLLKETARRARRQDLLRVLWSPFVVISHQIVLRSR